MQQLCGFVFLSPLHPAGLATELDPRHRAAQRIITDNLPPKSVRNSLENINAWASKKRLAVMFCENQILNNCLFSCILQELYLKLFSKTDFIWRFCSHFKIETPPVSTDV